MPPPWDPADHYTTAYEYYSLAHTSFRGFVSDFFTGLHYYPPAFHLGVALCFWLFGSGAMQAVLINLIALFVLMFSAYQIGSILFSHRVGGVAAILIAGYHLPACLVHEGFLDYVLLAEVTLSIWLLLRARDFTNRRDALIFGISVALGMLTKETFGLFLFFPLLFISVKVFISRNSRAIGNLFLAGLVAAVLMGIWYLPHLGDVREIFQVNQLGAVQEGEPTALSLQSFVAYSFILAKEQIQLPFVILFLMGLIYSIVRRRSASTMIYIWIGGGYLICTLLANKDPRYTLPYLPAIAIITALLADSEIRWFRNAIAIVLVSLALFSFANAQWPRPGRGFHRDLFIATLSLSPSINIFDRNLLNYDHHPSPDDWGMSKFTTRIAESPGQQSEIHVGCTLNREYFNPSNLGWNLRLRDYQKRLPRQAVISIFGPDDAELMIPSCDFLITSDRRDGASYPLLEKLDDEVTINGRYVYTKLDTIVLPDGAIVALYKRR